jgi:hypothetical protein
MAGRPGDLAGWPAIIVDGMPALLLTSFTASKAFSKSVGATSTHDMTLAGDASLKGRIILAAAVGDKLVKGSMAREVREKEVS